jgi:two-component system, sensor histidine kinase and response regulator
MMSSTHNLTSKAGTAPSYKILVVDDFPDTLFLLGVILGMEGGYQLSYANNGREALEAVEAASPDLILLDVLMPDMTGYEVVHCIRQNLSLPYVPIVLMTDHDEFSVAERLAVGADAFMLKPFGIEELLTCMQTILAHHSTKSTPRQDPCNSAHIGMKALKALL